MFTKRYDIQDVDTLKKRFAYMFTGPTISIEFYKGWFPIIVGLCFEIDRMLGEHRNSFHWVQIKEKFGAMRMHFDLQDLPELRAELQELVFEAGSESARCCMICSQPAGISQQSQQSGWIVTVCEVHGPEEVPKRGGRSLRALIKVPEHPEGPA